MSYWTYVNGTVRIDSEKKISDKDFEQIFGKICIWDSPQEVWDDWENHREDYLPMGSEGSLIYRPRLMTRIPNSNYPYRYKVKICGNLRSFSNWHIIYNWIKKCENTLVAMSNSSINRFETQFDITARCDFMGTYKYFHEDYGYKEPFFYKKEK